MTFITLHSLLMYNNMKQFSFSALAAVILLAGLFAGGCKKDSDSASVPTTEADITAKLAGTSSKMWLPVTGVDEDSTTGLVTGLRALKDCEKDDTTTFYTAASTIGTGKKLILTTGNNPCTGETKNQQGEAFYTVSVTSGVATLLIGGIWGGRITNLTNSSLKMEVVGKDSKKYNVESILRPNLNDKAQHAEA